MINQFGKWEVFAIESGDFRLDGGAMMGSVPKVLWEKTNPCDNLNRINLSLRCLLIDDGINKVLIETGMGNKIDDNFINMFHVRQSMFPLKDKLNKYGYQLGLKGKISSLKYLFEYNQVQPYTYGHRTILQNYSHMNQALAHPLGANFKEYINLLEFKKEKLTYKLKTMFSIVGLDSLDTHYGQNIFESDILASTGGQYSYGNYNGQGVSTTIFSIEPEISVKFKWFDIYASIYYRTKNSDLLDQNLLFYSLGIRNFIFPIFQDY